MTRERSHQLMIIAVTILAACSVEKAAATTPAVQSAAATQRAHSDAVRRLFRLVALADPAVEEELTKRTSMSDSDRVELRERFNEYRSEVDSTAEGFARDRPTSRELELAAHQMNERFSKDVLEPWLNGHTEVRARLLHRAEVAAALTYLLTSHSDGIIRAAVAAGMKPEQVEEARQDVRRAQQRLLRALRQREEADQANRIDQQADRLEQQVLVLEAAQECAMTSRALLDELCGLLPPGDEPTFLNSLQKESQPSTRALRD